MNPRTCSLRLFITNDQGVTSYYSLRPVPPADLGASVAGFLLTNTTKQPSPVYLVALAADGQVTCDCPQHNFAGNCKHADALAAAGVLPCALLGLLQQRTKLLDEAEAMLKQTEEKLAEVSARAVQLQTGVAAVQTGRPKRRTAA